MGHYGQLFLWGIFFFSTPSTYWSRKTMGNKVQVGVHMTPLYLLTNHYFEIFRKKKNSMGKTFSKIEQNRAKFQPIFNLKTVLNSENIGE